MTKDSAKLVYALLEVYKNLYTEKYGKAPVINKYREKWGTQDVLDSIGYEEAKALMTYYFKVSSDSRHSLSWFYYNFDKLEEMMEKVEADKVHRAKIREATRLMMETHDETLKRLENS